MGWQSQVVCRDFVPQGETVCGVGERLGGLHELLRVLPDLGCMRAKREPQADQVGLIKWNGQQVVIRG